MEDIPQNLQGLVGIAQRRAVGEYVEINLSFHSDYSYARKVEFPREPRFVVQSPSLIIDSSYGQLLVDKKTGIFRRYSYPLRGRTYKFCEKLNFYVEAKSKLEEAKISGEWSNISSEELKDVNKFLTNWWKMKPPKSI